MDIKSLKEKLLEIKNEESNRIFGIPNKNSKTDLYNEIIVELTNYLDAEMSIRDRIKFILLEYYELCDENLSLPFLMQKYVLTTNNTINKIIYNKYFTPLLKRIKNETNYLPNDASLSQRWFHIKNDIIIIPKCIVCNKDVPWGNNKYSPRCSQKCWSKSSENINRLVEKIKNTKWNDERKEKHIQRMTDKKWDDDAKKLHSVRMKGNTNFLKNNKPWNFNLPREQQPMFGKTRVGMKGELNPSYGITPSKYTGYGIKGYFKSKWFRSSLELFFLIYCHINNYNVKSAERKLYQVEYEIDGIKKTYSPDFIINDLIYEIKPYYKLNDNIVQIKFKKLLEKHKNCVLFTEFDMEVLICTLNMSIIDEYINNSLLNISDKEYKRLKNAIYDTQNTIKRGK